jgi:hypothetical protein
MSPSIAVLGNPHPFPDLVIFGESPFLDIPSHFMSSPHPFPFSGIFGEWTSMGVFANPQPSHGMSPSISVLGNTWGVPISGHSRTFQVISCHVPNFSPFRQSPSVSLFGNFWGVPIFDCHQPFQVIPRHVPNYSPFRQSPSISLFGHFWGIPISGRSKPFQAISSHVPINFPFRTFLGNPNFCTYLDIPGHFKSCPHQFPFSGIFGESPYLAIPSLPMSFPHIPITLTYNIPFNPQTSIHTPYNTYTYIYIHTPIHVYI